MSDQIAELREAALEYMSQIGQGYEAHGLPFGPAQAAADARLRAALAAPEQGQGGAGVSEANVGLPVERVVGPSGGENA